MARICHLQELILAGLIGGVVAEARFRSPPGAAGGEAGSGTFVEIFPRAIIDPAWRDRWQQEERTTAAVGERDGTGIANADIALNVGVVVAGPLRLGFAEKSYIGVGSIQRLVWQGQAVEHEFVGWHGAQHLVAQLLSRNVALDHLWPALAIAFVDAEDENPVTLDRTAHRAAELVEGEVGLRREELITGGQRVGLEIFKQAA